MPLVFTTRDHADWKLQRLLKRMLATSANTVTVVPITDDTTSNPAGDAPGPRGWRRLLHFYELTESSSTSRKQEDYRDTPSEQKQVTYSYTLFGWAFTQVSLPFLCCWNDDPELLHTNQPVLKLFGRNLRVHGPFACMLNAVYYGVGLAVDILGNLLWRPAYRWYRASRTIPPMANEPGKPKGGLIRCLRCEWVAHLVVTAVAYIHIVVSMFATNVYYLMLVTASVYTDAVVKRFKLIERSNESSPKEASHEKVAQITARLHGLFWLFVPGAALLAKMCEYLNENLAIFIFTDDLTEVSSVDTLPKLESTEVTADKLKEWPANCEERNQIITIKESMSTTYIRCQKIVQANKKYTVRQVSALEGDAAASDKDAKSGVAPTSRAFTVEATLDPTDKNESPSDGKPNRKARASWEPETSHFELVVNNSDCSEHTVRQGRSARAFTVRNTKFFYRECRTDQLVLGIDRGILASNISWVLGLIKFVFFFLAWVALTHDQSYFAARVVLNFLSLPIALISTIKRSIVFGIKYTKIREMMALKKSLKEGVEKVRQMRKLVPKLRAFAIKLELKFLKPKDLIREISKLPYDQPEQWPQLMVKSVHTLSSVKYGCKVMTDEAESLANMKAALDELFDGTGITAFSSTA